MIAAGRRESGGADRLPGLPGDAQDDEGDREADQGVAEVEAEADDDRAANDSERDEAVRTSVVAVGNEGGAIEALAGAEADQGGELVADEADRASGECGEIGERLAGQSGARSSARGRHRR